MTSDQLQAVGLLVSGLSSEEVAKKVGVCSRTLRRWKKDPEFAEELRDVFDNFSADMKARALIMVNKSMYMTHKSFNALNELLDDGHAANRLRASNTLLNAGLRWTRVLNYTDKWFAKPDDTAPRPGHGTGAPIRPEIPSESEDDDGANDKTEIRPARFGQPSPPIAPFSSLKDRPAVVVEAMARAAAARAAAKPAANPMSAPERTKSTPVESPAAETPSAASTSATNAAPGQPPTLLETADKSGHAKHPAAPRPGEKTAKTGHAKPWQKPTRAPFYQKFARRR
jgi:hypothetical protein